MHKFIKVVLNLFDGESGSATAGEGNETAQNSSETLKAGTVRNEIAKKGKSLGLSDDLMQSYQEAFDSKNKKSAEEAQKSTQTAEDTNSQSNASDFDEFIKTHKDEYNKRVSSLVKDRMTSRDKEISQLKSRIDAADKILNVISQKYSNVKTNDLSALLKAVEEDNDIWQQKALDSGISADEAKRQFNEDRTKNAMAAELEQLKKEKAASQLDARLQSIALETQKIYPEFNLQEEFRNPDFCAALDFIAQRNEAKNKETGKNDEIFNLTYAYELAHADEIRNNTIKKVSKATMSAVAKNIAANGSRPVENANTHSTPAKAKTVDELTDKEFDDLLRKIKNGTGHIPR